jgi:hypothetical protein
MRSRRTVAHLNAVCTCVFDAPLYPPSEMGTVKLGGGGGGVGDTVSLRQTVIKTVIREEECPRSK